MVGDPCGLLESFVFVCVNTKETPEVYGLATERWPAACNMQQTTQGSGPCQDNEMLLQTFLGFAGPQLHDGVTQKLPEVLLKEEYLQNQLLAAYVQLPPSQYSSRLMSSNYSTLGG